MAASVDTSVVLPPLTSPPRWAANQPPDWETVDGLRQQTSTIHDLVWSIRAELSTLHVPLPERVKQLDTSGSQSRLTSLVSALRAMPYPAELTAWINEARVLAAHAAGRFEDAITQMQRLLSPSEDTDYCHQLGRARQRLGDVLWDLEQLLTLLDAYLDAEETRPRGIVRDITWRLGRQAGLHEAACMLEKALTMLSVPLPHEQAQELRVALTRLLEQQRLSPPGRPAHDAPIQEAEAR